MLKPHTSVQPLCQEHARGCARCCGVDNFIDRSPEAEHRRLSRRTQLIEDSKIDQQRLIEARDLLLAEERDHIYCQEIPVCPFAIYLDDDRRIGCGIHPTRMPNHLDWRDLSVHDQKTCAHFFCAAHDWLKEDERLFAACAPKEAHSGLFTQVELIKPLYAYLTSITETHFKNYIEHASEEIAQIWYIILKTIPNHPKPGRYGLIQLSQNGIEKNLEQQLTHSTLGLYERRILLALHLDFQTHADAENFWLTLDKKLRKIMKDAYEKTIRLTARSSL